MILLFLAYFLASFSGNFTQVKYAKEMKCFFAVAVYSLITCTIAIIFFLFMTEFNPTFNKTIFIFALLFSIVVIISQYVGIIIYKYMRIIDIGLIRGALSLICTFLAGSIIYNESITMIATIRMLLSLIATIMLVLNNKKADNKTKNTLHGYLLCFALIISSVLVTIISKEFANLPIKQDENSYFLLVNIIGFIFSSIIIIISKKGDFTQIVGGFKEIDKTSYLYITVSTISSNLVSLITIWLLASNVSIILFTPLTSAMVVIIQVLTAAIIAKEKIPKIPILLSLATALLAFFN